VGSGTGGGTGSGSASGWGRLSRAVPSPLRWLVRNEVSLLRTYWLVVRRTREVPPGSPAFPYAGEQAPVFGVIAVLTLVEVVPVHFLVPWAWLRTVLLVLGVYGFLWAVGYYQGWRRRPHHLTDGVLVLRSGPGTAVGIPVTAIVRSGRGRRTWDRRGVRLQDEGTVTVTHSGETTAWVETSPGWALDVHGERVHGPTVHFTADDPSALVEAVGAPG
jgi:hypothetical protein